MIQYGRQAVLLSQQTTDDLKFSNTMEWNKHYRSLSESVDLNVLNRLHLSPPPRNDSEITSMEIQELLLKKKERNHQNQREIENELDGGNIFPLFSPNTEELDSIHRFITFIAPYIMHFKKKFDRVRPRILEPQIEPTIDPPGHPAYPSGHAAQVYGIALYMSQLHPHNKEKLMRIAHRVATNRELAGVHYSSDTEAGHQLARQLVPIFIESYNK